MVHSGVETLPPCRISRRRVRAQVHALLWLCALVSGPMAGAAHGAGPVNLTAAAADGKKGNDEAFDAGGTGGNGNNLPEFEYTFSEPLSSTAPNTPAFLLERSGGNGGDGGSSTLCCNGGSGGTGGYAGVVTLSGPATLTTTSTGSAGFLARVITGSGGNGGDSGSCCKGGDGGVGPADGNGWLTIYNSDTVDSAARWSIMTSQDGSPAFQAKSYAGNGGRGGTGASEGSSGGTGGAALSIKVGYVDLDTGFATPFVLDAQTLGDQSPGISIALSPMDSTKPTGNGGQGGANDTLVGGGGGTGGTPFDSYLVLGSSSIRTSGDASPGVVGSSQGGTGGQGGKGKTFGDGGSGGTGGGGGSLEVYLYDQNTIATQGEGSHGIAVYSLGGNGGQSGDGSWVSNPGPPGAAAASGPVSVDLSQSSATTVSTQGDNAFGILAQSIGGHGGSASAAYGLVDFAVSGGSAGNGGVVTVNNGLGNVPVGAVPAAISTEGQSSPAIGAYSLGGGGGQGGTAFGAFYAGGGSGGAGGAGESVTVMNAGALTTKNYASDGILALSIGGAGGSGGSTAALASVGGRAGPASNGGPVVVQNLGVIQTGTAPDATPESGVCAGCSLGILAQSIGGGGGKAGSSAGWFGLGGTGGGGGSGGEVVVANAGSISTALDQSPAIVGQSIGGGGGNGGASGAIGPGGSLAIGGSGGSGGNGGAVTVTIPTGAANIATSGVDSHGVHAQSIGGGGGNAGFAAAGAVGVGFPAVAVALGGTGGAGGSGADATVNAIDSSDSGTPGSVTTRGDGANGLFAQSLGGGGGNGGLSVGLAAGNAGALGLSIGGSGGGGGTSADATVMSDRTITTGGDRSAAMIAQSIGGGGGNGGMAISGSVAVSSPGVSLALGGSAGSGNTAGRAVMRSNNALTTEGDDAPGIVGQSIGGGGGRGGLAVSAALSLSSPTGLGLSLGGSGGTGADSRTFSNESTVQLTNYSGGITTGGARSPGILAQAIGGGGGSGGLSVAASLSTSQTLNLGGSIGGSGGVAGAGAPTLAHSYAPITTRGEQSEGILAQSIGGGGGSGGTAVTGGLTLSGGASVGATLGGAGGAGGAGSTIEVISTEAISTSGGQSTGILAQSIGGGGGSGGTSITGTSSTGSSKALAVAVGGQGSGGGSASTVNVTVQGKLGTAGDQSDGVLAQSIGGSGGRGGTSVAGNVATSGSTDLAVSVGGGAGTGGNGGAVNISLSDGQIVATGDGSRGIVAQSIGGGGGHGGTAVTGAFTSSSSTKDLSVGIGRAGGGGGTGGAVTVTNTSGISTGSSADLAAGLTGEHGILAQSIGGSGGSGGLSASADTNLGNRSLTVDIGGGGGGGATSSAVRVSNSAAILTQGYVSHGILAQSIAGGGGDGGGTASFGVSSKSSKGLGVSVGGTGGGGAASNTVTVTLGSGSAIQTTSQGSRGIIAQSIAGGGGNGGGNLFKTQSGANDPDQLSLAVGGAGGVASNAGAVILASTAAMSVTTGSGNPVTSDAGSVYQGHGVQLQSIGGGGGTGAAGIQGAVKPSSTQGAIDIGVGGKGKGGGSGGPVTAGTTATPLSGSITTGDYSAFGLFAQSIGGGGGSGASGILGDVTNNAAKGLTIGVGGSGGSGGSGGAVSVVSNLAIGTDGDGSKGLVAQSIGGGGGAGAQGIQGNVSGASDSGTKQITFGLGGSGGGGGAGGAVTLTNGGAISTGGKGSDGGPLDQMDAILAQSIGGGGGIGGLGIAGNIANSSQATAMSLTIGIGEGGGGAGNGGLVKVANTGALSAAGNGSRGIAAQSIGGGGGMAGAGITGNITAPSDASSDYQVDFGLGGKAGGGGAGGQVTVSNTGAITTAYSGGGSGSDQGGMHGILAQSIGGGGGAGGVGVHGIVIGSDNADTLQITVGGGGGSGGSGFMGSIGATVATAGVGVSNSATIATLGDGSIGILAQNIGGGGGNASALLNGTVSSGAKDSSGGDSSGGDTLTLAIGAQGGSGGAGGTVQVYNTGAITTGTAKSTANPKIRQAHGIEAQSVGGGGGNGRLSAGVVLGPTQNAGYERGVQATLGSVSEGGAGAAVRVDNASVTSGSGSITTYAMHAYGILAQSIGGGGGSGADAGGIGTQNPSDRWLLDVSLGAGASSAKGGGSGGAVTVDNAGKVSTYGDGSVGVFAQSIGGGGGLAGDGAGARQAVAGSVATTLNAVVSLNVGATSGNNGNGGAVTVANDGSITTRGTDAVGIIAQSVGGGGGRGGSAIAGRSGIVTVGGTGGASGNGGAITVTGSGAIVTGKTLGGRASQATSVSQAHGILAQSVGGGGGHAGTTSLSDSSRFASKLDMAATKDNSGNAGAVTVNYQGPITTAGDSSVGILAQSVGGGGGIAGEVTQTVTGALVGSLGGNGTAGPISIALGSDGGASGITTTGNSAHGIFAQGAGGGGTTTTTNTMVSVAVGADVKVSGGGAHGVYAQSVGDGMGTIAVRVDPGATVQGGGSAPDGGTDDGAGIFIQDGTQATIVNAGTVTSVLGTQGVAIRVVDTVASVENAGTITGQILKASSIELLNHPDGLINAGPLLDVDTLTNHGTIDPGGAGRIGSTRITGDLTQGGRGVIAVDLNPGAAGGRGMADQINIGGWAHLDGRIAVNLIEIWQPHEGGQSVPVLTAAGGLSLSGADVSRSAVAQYRLDQRTPNALQLSYNIDFANAGILARTNDNQDDIARYIHGIYRAQALDDDIARALIAIEDTASYTRVMNSLSAEIAIDNQITTLLSGIRFDDDLLGCGERGGDYRFFDQGQCGWLRLGGQRFEQQEVSDNLGFDEDTWQLAGGGQIPMGNGWHLGGALSYEGSNLDADDSYASSDGERFRVGIVAKRRFDASELSGSVSVGYGEFDINRNPWPGVNIDGAQTLWLYSAQLRAAHLFERGRWRFTPRIDLGLDYLSMAEFNESGGSDFRIRHAGEDTAYVNLQPAIDIATEIETDDGLLIRPRLSLGITQFIGASAPSVTGRFALAPPDVAPFTTRTELDKTRFDVAASLDIFTRKDTVVRAELFGSFSDTTESYGGGLKIAMPF